MAKNLYGVRYCWTDKDGKKREGRTVVTHFSQLEAEAQFQRQNQHVRVIHARAVVMPVPAVQEVAS